MRSCWKPNLGLLAPRIKTPSNVLLPIRSIPDKTLLGNRVEVYNGKNLVSLVVKNHMLNKKLSNFVSTKYTGKIIHVKKKKRKK